MILRIYLVVANTIIGWFWVPVCQQQQRGEVLVTPTSSHRPPKSGKSDQYRERGFKLSKNPRARLRFFFFGSNSGFFYFLGAPRRPCGVQPTVLDALICSFWKRANIIWMTIQLCGVHCHCFIHKVHNQAHWECANKCEGASKCVHDL